MGKPLKVIVFATAREGKRVYFGKYGIWTAYQERAQRMNEARANVIIEAMQNGAAGPEVSQFGYQSA